MEWIKCSERMPIKSTDFEHYIDIEVNVYDGYQVSSTNCRAGNPGGDKGLFWCEFDPYGSVNPEDITHWQPLPQPPAD